MGVGEPHQRGSSMLSTIKGWGKAVMGHEEGMVAYKCMSLFSEKSVKITWNKLYNIDKWKILWEIFVVKSMIISWEVFNRAI